MAIRIGFMTFVCPEWSIEKMVGFAKEAGYDGVEIRVDAGHSHGVSSESSQQERRSLKTLFRRQGVDVSCIASSASFNFSDSRTRAQNIEAAKQDVMLADDLGARVVRMFAGRGTEGMSVLTDEAAEYVADAFTLIGEYAKDHGVCPLLEAGHDVIVTAVEAAQVLERVDTPNFGINWNHSDLDREAFNLLQDHLRHIHVHEEVLPWSRFSREMIFKNFPQDNRNITNLATKLKTIDFDGFISLEIMAKKYGNQIPEQLLIETSKRLNRLVAQA